MNMSTRARTTETAMREKVNVFIHFLASLVILSKYGHLKHNLLLIIVRILPSLPLLNRMAKPARGRECEPPEQSASEIKLNDKIYNQLTWGEWCSRTRTRERNGDDENQQEKNDNNTVHKSENI